MYLKKAMELTNDMIKYFWTIKRVGFSYMAATVSNSLPDQRKYTTEPFRPVIRLQL